MMRLDICIPAYNEEGVIGPAVQAVRAAFKDRADIELSVLVADNNSSDMTSARASEAGARVVPAPVQGKGAAVRAAARVSNADLFGFVDADLSADPQEFLNLLPHLEKDAGDIVIGSRLHKDAVVNRSFLRTLSSKLFNIFRRLMLGLGIEDTQCGLKLLNPRAKEILITGREQGWFFDIELLAHAHAQGLKIIEVPIAWTEERFPGRKSKLNLVRDGMQGMQAILRIRHRM